MTGRNSKCMAAALAVAAVGVPVVPASWTGSARATPLGRHTLTASQLSRDLTAAARTRHLPARLDPRLSTASTAQPVIIRNGCHARRPAITSRLCIYGDESSHTSVVLFGDSHAAAWFPALELIARRRHWRLVVMTKSGCPPAEVKIVRAGASYGTCQQWRTNIKAQIAALHPALVIAATATYREQPAATPLPGVPTGNGGPWQDGWTAIFSFLRGAAGHVVLVSDVPTLRVRAPACALKHQSDIRRCNTKRSAAIRLPAVKAQEIAIARREHVDVIDPVSWFCTRTTCPVIVHHIVVYRDYAHMTPPWSRFIAPVLADAITPLLKAPTPASR
jgi:hypothetical protein